MARSTKSKLLVGCVLLVGGGIAASSQAANTVIPGSACQPRDESDLYLIQNYGFFTNLNTGTTKIHCPLTRLNQAGTLHQIFVRLYNHSTSDPTPSCEVWSVDGNGTYADWSVNSTNLAGMSSLGFDLSSFTEYVGGSYGVECDLRQYDSILSIRYHEN